MITLEIDDDDFHRGLGRLLKNATNARPMMRAIATEMTSITEDNFERESFGSDRWEKSQRATDENGKTLQKRGQLAASDIIVAQLETDFTVKRLMITKQMSAGEINEIFGPDAKSIPPVWLKAENQEHSHIFLKPEQELIVWGVVTYIIKDARK